HCHIVLSDISEGMINDAQKLLADVGYDFEYQIIDAQSIPLQKNHFDLVIANHILFFIPNIRQTLQEIKRVLKPEGKLYATTASMEHLKELEQIAVEFDARLELYEKPTQCFNLENGKAILEEYYTNVERYDYKDELVIPVVETLITYLRSVYKSKEFAFFQNKLPELRRFFQKKINLNQSITITSYSGMFKAEKSGVRN
ncbi:MAG: methyltransferase domain-containing protein, partial [Candidatus Hodarchaeota archaeon]